MTRIFNRTTIAAAAVLVILWRQTISVWMADYYWWPLRETRIWGALLLVSLIVLLAVSRPAQQGRRLLRGAGIGTAAILRDRFLLALTLGVSFLAWFIATGKGSTDIEYFLYGLEGRGTGAASGLKDFIIAAWWGEIPSWQLTLLAIVAGGIVFLLLRLGPRNFAFLLLAVPATALSSLYDKYTDEKVSSQARWTVVFLIIGIFAFWRLGQWYNAAFFSFALTVVVWRNWPRENPLWPGFIPVEPFEVPVMRLLARPDQAMVITVGFIIVFICTLGFVYTRDAGFLIVGLAGAQLFFLWYVNKRPVTLDAWLRLEVNPGKPPSMTIYRQRSIAGSISWVPVKLGTLRLKERPGLMDNFFRIYGYGLIETEPIGIVREAGEVETFEFFVLLVHLRFPVDPANPPPEDQQEGWLKGFQALQRCIQALG